MEQILIRKAGAADVALLQQIGRQTFSETFAASNSEENMRQYLAEGFASEKLLAELSNPDAQFFFAEWNNELIGYLKINTGQSQTELQDQASLEIERIYVLQAFHGKKVGQVLYEKALHLATAAGVRYVWLGVWEENKRALRFYEKNGFVAFDKHIFRLGDDAQTDIMMKFELPAA